MTQISDNNKKIKNIRSELHIKDTYSLIYKCYSDITKEYKFCENFEYFFEEGYL